MYSVVVFDRVLTTVNKKEDAEQVCILLGSLLSMDCSVIETEDSTNLVHGQALSSLFQLLDGLQTSANLGKQEESGTSE